VSRGKPGAYRAARTRRHRRWRLDRTRFLLQRRRRRAPQSGRLDLKTISAIIALVRRGVPVLRAKRAVEEILERGRVAVVVPKVENASALASEMADAGFLAAKVAARQIDVRALRERLGLTQEQFALRYALDLDAVRNWEHKRRKPDPAAQGYLRVIARLPEQAGEAQEEAIAGT